MGSIKNQFRKFYRLDYLPTLAQNAFRQDAIAPDRCRQLGERETIERQLLTRGLHRFDRPLMHVTRTGWIVGMPA